MDSGLSISPFLLLCSSHCYALCANKDMFSTRTRNQRWALPHFHFLSVQLESALFIGKSIYTSAKADNSKAFEADRRAVLVTRNIGVGHQGLVKFACIMNILPPMNENAYRDHVQAVRDAAECTAKKSMSKAADEVKEFYEPDEEGMYNIVVLGNGTWRKRGFSSSFGVVPALSTITGKALDCEIMSKECGECKLTRGKGGTEEFDEWWEQHQYKCQAHFALLCRCAGNIPEIGLTAQYPVC